MVQSLCTRFSPVLLSIPHPSSPSLGKNAAPDSPIAYHAFPSPAMLAAPDTSATLRSLGFGYRAEYLQRTAQMLVEDHGEHGAEDFVKGLRKKDTEEARTELLKFVGVGRKVADCVLLMSLDKHEVVPVDTHVHQIAIKHYGFRGAGHGTKPTMTPKLYDELQMKLTGVWGEHAGWAHSVLFTADLKSFATYGLPTPSPSVSPEKPRAHAKGKTKAVSLLSDSDVLPPPPLSVKRKRVAVEMLGTENRITLLQPEELGPDGLADRVKRRRRKNLVGGYAESVPA